MGRTTARVPRCRSGSAPTRGRCCLSGERPCTAWGAGGSTIRSKRRPFLGRALAAAPGARPELQSCTLAAHRWAVATLIAPPRPGLRAYARRSTTGPPRHRPSGRAPISLPISLSQGTDDDLPRVACRVRGHPLGRVLLRAARDLRPPGREPSPGSSFATQIPRCAQDDTALLVTRGGYHYRSSGWTSTSRIQPVRPSSTRKRRQRKPPAWLDSPVAARSVPGASEPCVG